MKTADPINPAAGLSVALRNLAVNATDKDTQNHLHALATDAHGLAYSHAVLLDFADLVDRLAVQMRCQIAGTSHMDPNDSRIPAMTGRIDMDLAQLQARARTLLNP